jgi:transcriptional regulator with XRE-family HTH domain
MENREIADIIFGKLLRTRRVSAGYSQEQLALEAGLTRNYISLLELGQRSPTLRSIVRLANCFDITVGKLIEEFDINYQIQKDQSTNQT